MRVKMIAFSLLVAMAFGLSLKGEHEDRYTASRLSKQTAIPSNLAGPDMSPGPSSVHQHSNLEGGASLPLLVDGQKTPEQVPTSVAYKHLISTTAIGEAASETQVAVRDVLVARIGLEEADRIAYVETLRGVAAALATLDEQRQAVGVGGTSTHVTLNYLKAQRDIVLEQAVSGLRAALSQDGMTRLDEHVSVYVKRRVRIYGTGE